MIKKIIKDLLKKLLSCMGMEIVPTGKNCMPAPPGYIRAAETVAAAGKECVSVCDYVEDAWNQQGDTQKIIDQMDSYKIFQIENPHVLEIGPGTGRYLEKVINKCRPSKYEIYETAEDWSEWLQKTYRITAHEADGVSFAQSEDHSVDLLHAHGVFVYLPFLVSCRYFFEIFRVLKNGGAAIFDIYSEDCFDKLNLEAWLKSESNYPRFLSTEFVVSLFEKNNFSFTGSFMNKHGNGQSKYLIFKKNEMTLNVLS